MTVGYARVSTVDQDPEYQIRELERKGCEKSFTDRCRGRAKHRPQLAAAFAFLRKGDQLAVWRLDRLGRNVPHLIQLVRDIEARGCRTTGRVPRYASARENPAAEKRNWLLTHRSCGRGQNF